MACRSYVTTRYSSAKRSICGRSATRGTESVASTRASGGSWYTSRLAAVVNGPNGHLQTEASDRIRKSHTDTLLEGHSQSGYSSSLISSIGYFGRETCWWSNFRGSIAASPGLLMGMTWLAIGS